MRNRQETANTYSDLIRQAFQATASTKHAKQGDLAVARHLQASGHLTDYPEDSLRKVVSLWREQDEYAQSRCPDVEEPDFISEPLEQYTLTSSVVYAESGTVSTTSSVKHEPPQPSDPGFDDLVKRYATASQARMLTDHRVERNLRIDNAERVGVLCDIHGPHRDRDAVEIAVEFLKKQGIDCLILNGDALDLTAVSRWPTPIRDRASLPDELEDGRHLMRAFETYFSDAQLVWSFGNHEERMENYLLKRAPELFGTEGLDLTTLMHMNLGRWKVVEQKASLQVGDYYVLHGHETLMKSAGLAPAKKIQDKTGLQSIVGHFHQTDSYKFRKLNGEVMHSHTVGCLCNLSPVYMPFNNWNHGFLMLEKRGAKWQAKNYAIYDNEVHLR